MLKCLNSIILSMGLSAPPPTGLIGFLKQAGQIRVDYRSHKVKSYGNP